ncbi:uncharacterized protein LOC106070052 [Biomphalaria glabrata]|uniref:Uncharacterized protein LOC106070052 n=1 Tax=Biomphalaria glabrata TaxID=6526 RepID=A0A9U8EFT0_BIOGL|nr:uncharacterized protein LOC106070052 [Biomphalaria glabrata]KAI8789743.1 P2Y purinoceptor 2 [Biomphalaria glabrata]
MNATEETMPVPVLSIETYYRLVVGFVLVCLPIVSVVSVLNNALSQLTFISQGLKEHVTFTLFCLSLADFLVALASLGFVFSAPLLLVPLGTGSLMTNLAFTWMRVMFSDIVVGIIVFISVERSCCVAFPFRFKLMFSIKKSIIFLAAIVFFVIGNYIPVYTTFCLDTVLDSSTNTTVFYGCSPPYSAIIFKHIGITFGTILSLACEVSTSISAVVMHVCLRRSSQLRFLMKTAQDIQGSSNKSSTTLSRKEERAVKMVLVVATVYLLTSVPKVVFNLSLAVSEEMTYGKYSLIGNIIGFTSYITGTINGTFHLFVFYRYSSLFRKTFRRKFFHLSE